MKDKSSIARRQRYTAALRLIEQAKEKPSDPKDNGPKRRPSRVHRMVPPAEVKVVVG